MLKRHAWRRRSKNTEYLLQVMPLMSTVATLDRHVKKRTLESHDSRKDQSKLEGFGARVVL